MRNTSLIATALIAAGCLVSAANAKPPKSDYPALRVVTDKKSYGANAPVKMIFTIKNTGTKPINLTFSSGKRYDFEILQNRKSLWHWSQGRVFTQDIENEILDAGKAKTYTETYQPGRAGNPLLASGIYTVKASFATMSEAKPAAITTFKVAVGK